MSHDPRDDPIGIDFPVWVVADIDEFTVAGLADAVPTLRHDNDTLLLIFTDDDLAERFIDASGSPSAAQPTEIADAAVLLAVVTIAANAGATHVVVDYTANKQAPTGATDIRRYTDSLARFLLATAQEDSEG